MPQLQLQGSSRPAEAAAPEERSWIESVRSELDGYYIAVAEFETSDPGDVLAKLASIHARLVGLRVQLQRSASQRATSIRTKEVDPLIDALEFQFKVVSRIIALAEQEWRIAGGAN